jgi:RNA polymerase-binding transcription factor DksA
MNDQRCTVCLGHGFISSETGEPIPSQALGFRSDALECMECSPDEEQDAALSEERP